MAQKIILIIIIIATLVLQFSCNCKTETIYFYQFQDRTDCDYCFPAYCFYYDTAFHYTAIQFGFYENKSGFLRDSLFYTSMRDSIVAMKIPSSHSGDYYDSISCYCEYPSHWRFTFEMTVSKQGKCKLFIHSPYYKEGLYLFELTSSERRLIDFSACQLSTNDTGLYMTFEKKTFVPGDPVFFLIKLYRGDKIFSYIGNQDADNVPDEVFFFRDAMGAIAQNHSSKHSLTSEDIFYQHFSNELYRILNQSSIDKKN